MSWTPSDGEFVNVVYGEYSDYKQVVLEEFNPSQSSFKGHMARFELGLLFPDNEEGYKKARKRAGIPTTGATWNKGL